MSPQLGKLEVFYPQKLIDGITSDFLKNNRTVKIVNKSLLILNTKYLILYLTLHFFHHNFRGAFRLEFLDKIIRHSGKRSASRIRFWTSQNDLIKKYQLQDFVYPVFLLLKKYYQTPISNSFLQSIKPSNYLRSKIYHLGSIFDDEPRISAGINRFRNLFLFSPQPFRKKLFVFISPQVLYSIFWVLKQKLFSLLSKH